MSDPTPSGARCWAMVPSHYGQASRTDVTEAVQVAYDLVIGGMDFGSGFLTIEELVPLYRLAQVCGFDDHKLRDYEEQLTRRAFKDVVEVDS